jgi:hypothetical protein
MTISSWEFLAPELSRRQLVPERSERVSTRKFQASVTFSDIHHTSRQSIARTCERNAPQQLHISVLLLDLLNVLGAIHGIHKSAAWDA